MANKHTQKVQCVNQVAFPTTDLTTALQRIVQRLLHTISQDKTGGVDDTTTRTQTIASCPVIN